MKEPIKAKIVKSRVSPGLVTLRASSIEAYQRTATPLKQLMTKRGYKPGDIVYIVPAEEFERGGLER